jgi:hypothetical protein
MRLPGSCLALIALAGLADARADSMRCGSRLIADEDLIDKVIDLCGEPSDRWRTWIVRQPRYELNGNEYPFPGSEDVPVDVLVYDLGPNKLVRKLRFVAGKLESIETLGHGTSR